MITALCIVVVIFLACSYAFAPYMYSASQNWKQEKSRAIARSEGIEIPAMIVNWNTRFLFQYYVRITAESTFDGVKYTFEDPWIFENDLRVLLKLTDPPYAVGTQIRIKYMKNDPKIFTFLF
jgi:hypothetical protein